MRHLKKLICLSIVLSMFCSLNVFALEIDDMEEIGIPSNISMIEHNLITGEIEEKVYQENVNLTDTAMFLDPCMPSSIIGDDDREPIDYASGMPAAAIGKLLISGPNGKTYGGTGFLVADDLVLTAGHCLDSDIMGGHATSIVFKAGLNPDGTYIAAANAHESYLPAEWENNRNSDWDWALLRLDKSLGSTIGYINCRVETSPTGKSCEIQGYAGDWSTGGNTGVTQVVGYGSVLAHTTYKMYYNADTYKGMSGAPVFIAYAYGEYGALIGVSGIHTSGTNDTETRNSGTRITPSILTVISNKQ